MNMHRICLLSLACAFSSATLSAQGTTSYQAEETDAVTVTVGLRFGNEPLELDSRWYTTEAGDSVRINRFECYLTGFSAGYADGSVATEADSYHLIDASEDGTLTFRLNGIPAGDIRELRFSIGVDSAKSVSGVFGGDLDPVHGMYWAWNSGYINVKLEGTSPSCATFHHAFEFHIGGYLPHQRTLREVSFPVSSEQAVSGITLIADVSSWFADTALAQTNRIVTPGPDAVRMADRFTHLFKLQ